MLHRSLVFTIALFACAAQSQEPTVATPDAQPSAETDTEMYANPPRVASRANPMTGFEFFLSLEVLAFGFGVVFIEYLLLRSSRLKAEEALRVFGVTLIVVGTLFAVVAGFGASQIGPAMGPFGTIAGYLLGKRVSSTPESREKTIPEKDLK